MNFRQIEVFRAVMLARSMTVAAQTLHTSQPNISRVIAQLEGEIGFPLFERRGAILMPTPEGESFFSEVERSFAGLDMLKSHARSIKQHGGGTLRIGAVPSMAMSIVPEVILCFRGMYPEAAITVLTNDSPTVVKWTSMGQCDISIVSYVADPAGIELVASRHEAAVCVVPDNSALARKSSITPGDLDGLSFISLPMHDGTRARIDAAFTEDRRKMVVETPYAATICKMVGMGLGVSIVSPLVFQSVNQSSITAIPFEPRIELESYVIQSKGRVPSKLANAFLECFHRVYLPNDPE